MALLWTLIIGGVIGWLAGGIIGRQMPGGIVGQVAAGIIGAWLGRALLGGWGPEAGGIYIVPALIGAIVFLLIVGAVSRAGRR